MAQGGYLQRLRTFLNHIRNPLDVRYRPGACLAGRDLEGNEYYEIESSEGRRPHREVIVKGVNLACDIVKYDLPVEWESWLRFRRQDPPTIEELQKNVAFSHILAERVKKVEAKEAELREQAVAAGLVSATPTQVGHAAMPVYHKQTGKASSGGASYQPGSWKKVAEVKEEEITPQADEKVFQPEAWKPPGQ